MKMKRTGFALLKDGDVSERLGQVGTQRLRIRVRLCVQTLGSTEKGVKP